MGQTGQTRAAGAAQSTSSNARSTTGAAARGTGDDTAPAGGLGAGMEGDRGLVSMDRAAPGWARPLVAIFSTGIALCLAAFCLAALYVDTLVVDAGEPAMAPILLGLALIPAAGLMILEFAQARALAGYRLYREAWAARTQAAAALVAVAALGFLHPLLAAAPLAGIALGAGAIRLAARRRARGDEPLWDFLPAESVPILTGRDATGLRLAATTPETPGLLAPALRVLRWLVLAGGFAAAGALAAQEVLAPAAVPAAALLSFWATGPVFEALVAATRADPLVAEAAAGVCALAPAPDEEDAGQAPGTLSVRGLTVTAPGGWHILSDVGFTAAPGEIIGLQGPPGSGKSMLLRALLAPGDLSGLEVRGAVHLGGQSLWDRRAEARTAPAALVPPDPPMLPATGAQNLAFFEGGAALDRGRRILEQMVFAADLVDKICATPDARRLSQGERKALGFARAFLLSPGVLLLDRPEDGASDKLVDAVAARLRQEVRAGRTVILATANRALLELCDKLVMLSDGRLVDMGPAEEIRARAAAGWQRFVGARSLETEENLETWIRSHFRRDGDEANRRRACLVAAEMLAFSCASAPPMTRQTLAFEFKHAEGHCTIRMLDRDVAVSSGTLERARAEAEAFDDSGRMSPLATVMSLAEAVEATVEQDRRVLSVRIATYDPRKTGGKPPEALPSASPAPAGGEG